MEGRGLAMGQQRTSNGFFIFCLWGYLGRYPFSFSFSFSFSFFPSSYIRGLYERFDEHSWHLYINKRHRDVNYTLTPYDVHLPSLPLLTPSRTSCTRRTHEPSWDDDGIYTRSTNPSSLLFPQIPSARSAHCTDYTSVPFFNPFPLHTYYPRTPRNNCRGICQPTFLYLTLSIYAIYLWEAFCVSS